MNNNDLIVMFHDLFDQFKEAKPNWSLERIYENLNECLYTAYEEQQE